MQTWAQAFTRARSGRVVQRCHNRNSREIMWPGYMNEVMHRKHAWRMLGIWEKSVSWVLASEEDGWLSRLAEARPVVCGMGHTWWWWGWGCRWKSQHRKILSLSPYVEKPFNSKVIKSFVPELRSRKVFCVSGFLCYLYVRY